MISYREVAAALYGAWRLARLDSRGLSYFNTTVTGFWRSFFAAVICAPGHIVIVSADYASPALAVSSERFFAVHGIAYVIGWTAFPLVMASVSRLINRERQYVRYIVAGNWANVLQTVLYLLAIALAGTGIKAFTMLPLIAILLIFLYQWYVTRTALMVSGPQAATLVGLDLLIRIVLTTVVGLMLPEVAT